MDDEKIIELFFSRDEGAIDVTVDKYGRHLTSLALGILGNISDSQECVNDTYYRAWNSIPPTRPTSLMAYLSKITRNLALNKLRDGRRHSLGMTLILDEISEIIPDGGDITDELALRSAINDFVRALEPKQRKIFLKRYFYMMSVKDISKEMGMKVGTVKSIMSRTRSALRDYLTERRIEI